MERHPHHPDDEPRPAVNSYGTDDPETQAHIENVRIDAVRERHRNRAALERLVALGLSPDDAEVIIEADQAIMREQSGTEPGGDASIENTRDDLANLVALKHQPHGAAALTALAADLRRGTLGMGALMAPRETVADYQAIGLDRRDALTVAGFEYFLRYRLAIADDPGARTGLEPESQSLELHPRVYITASAEDDPDIEHGRWIDAVQQSEEIEEEIDELVRLFPDPSTTRWAVTSARDLGDLDLTGVHDAELLAALGQGVADHGPAFLAWANLHSTDDRELLGRFSDFFVGSYRSEHDWAEAVAIDLRWPDHLDRVVDPALRPFVRIDYDKIARSTRDSWDVVTGPDGRTYVFLR